jgi:hypothetical protein
MIIDRLLQFIEYKSINKSQFYKEVGLSNGFLDKRKDMGVSKLKKVMEAYPDLSEKWLIKGEGPILKSVVEKPPDKELDKYLIDVQRKLIYKLEEDNERLKKQIKRGNGHK